MLVTGFHSKDGDDDRDDDEKRWAQFVSAWGLREGMATTEGLLHAPWHSGLYQGLVLSLSCLNPTIMVTILQNGTTSESQQKLAGILDETAIA